jgi:hypothetical protein
VETTWIRRKPDRGGDSFAIKLAAEHRQQLLHHAANRNAEVQSAFPLGIRIGGETHRNRPGIETQTNLVCAGKGRYRHTQRRGRAERRMSGEGQFLAGGEDADTHSFARVGLRRQAKRRLREASLTRHSLHFNVTHTCGVKEHSELVSSERRLSKHVQQQVAIRPRHGFSRDLPVTFVDSRLLKTAPTLC